MPTAVEVSSFTLWWLLPALLAIGAIAFALLRRRGIQQDEAVAEPAAVAPQAAPSPPSPSPPAPIIVSALDFDLRPIRAGLNLLSATVEGEVIVANRGATTINDIRMAASLAGARAGQDAELAALQEQPIGRPAAPAFALAPGEVKAVRIVAALPRDAIAPIVAAGRPMFVPLVAIRARYRDGEVEGQAGRIFVVGIERVDSPKLAPFWLDQPSRTVEQVAARPHRG